jgi:tetratricopeptide (TPR) repeat protein
LERAAAAGEKAIDLDPSDADGWLTLSFAYRFKGALQQELALWRRRADLDPGDTTARIRGGWVLWFTGRPDEALPWLHAAAAQKPDDRWVHFFLGNANLALGNYAEAERMYRKPLELYPDHSSAHAGVIWSLLAAGKDEEARARMRLLQASGLDGDRYFVKLADIEYFLGEDESALAHARASVDREPEERYWPRGFCASTILGAVLWPTDRRAAEEELSRSDRIDRETRSAVPDSPRRRRVPVACERPRRRDSGSSLDDLPVRILPRDLVAAELEQVAAADLDPLSRGGRTREEPFGATSLAADPVAVVAPVHVGDACEPARESIANALPPFEPPPARIRSARHLQYAIVGEESHHRIEIMCVERA